MAEFQIRTGKARQTHRRPQVVGYRWYGDREVEMLSCGHERLTNDGGLPDEDEVWEDHACLKYLAELPSRRACQECKVPHRGLR